MITALYGSHEQIRSPFFNLAPSFTNKCAPYGMLLLTITLLVPGSTIRNSPERPNTTSTLPSSVSKVTVLMFSNSITPSNLALI